MAEIDGANNEDDTQFRMSSVKTAGYTFELYPPPEKKPYSFSVGDRVCVMKGSESFAKAEVVEHVVTDDRFKVRYKDGSTYHCRRSRMVPLTGSNQIIVTAHTNHYRALAKIHAEKEDSFLELGCDLGITTYILSQLCARALGVDKAHDRLALARETYPSARFEQADILSDEGALKRVGAGFNKVLIDINGNRPLHAVLLATHRVCDDLRPNLVVVKSVELAELLTKQLLPRDLGQGQFGVGVGGKEEGTAVTRRRRNKLNLTVLPAVAAALLDAAGGCLHQAPHPADPIAAAAAAAGGGGGTGTAGEAGAAASTINSSCSSSNSGSTTTVVGRKRGLDDDNELRQQQQQPPPQGVGCEGGVGGEGCDTILPSQLRLWCQKKLWTVKVREGGKEGGGGGGRRRWICSCHRGR